MGQFYDFKKLSNCRNKSSTLKTMCMMAVAKIKCLLILNRPNSGRCELAFHRLYVCVCVCVRALKADKTNIASAPTYAHLLINTFMHTHIDMNMNGTETRNKSSLTHTVHAMTLVFHVAYFSFKSHRTHILCNLIYLLSYSAYNSRMVTTN